MWSEGSNQKERAFGPRNPSVARNPSGGRKLRRKVTADEREGIDFLQRDLKYRLQNYAEQKAHRCAKTCIIKGIYSKENNGFLKTSKD